MQSAINPEFHSMLEDSAPVEQSHVGDIDLRQLLFVLRRNKIIIAVIVAAAMVLGVLATMLMVPKYKATSKVLIEQQAEQIVEGGDLQNQNTSPQDADRYLQTQIDLIASHGLAARVVDTAKLANDETFFRVFGGKMPTASDLPANAKGDKALQEMRADAAAALLEKGLTTELPPESRVISISVSSASPAYSAKIADAYAQDYIEANLNRKFQSSDYARKYLSTQLEAARNQLEQSETNLNQYARVAGLIRTSGSDSGQDTDTALSVTNDTLVQMNTAASTAETARIDAQQQWDTISNEPILSISQVLNNASVQTLLTQRAGLEAQLAEERAQHLDSYPTVRSLSARIKELDARINTIGNAIKHSIYLDYVSAREKEDALKASVTGMRDQALGEQDRSVHYSVLKRVADTNRSLYESLLERYNQLNAGAGATLNNVMLVDSADLPTTPYSPNLVLNLALAFVGGLMIAGVAVFGIEYFDDVLHSPEDVETKLGLPLLGLMPLVADGETDLEHLEAKSPIAEAYHTMVTNLAFSTPTGMPRSIMVTSTSEAQGKTTTSHAIAADYARLGHKVLLIDADLRRPTLHRRLPDTRTPGLTAVLTGTATMEEVCQPSASSPNLTYMTALPIPPDPSMILSSPKLDTVIKDLGNSYDLIVIDSAPLLGISDSAQIATKVEGVLLMIDATQFVQRSIKATLRRLKLVKARMLGAALTKYNPKNASGDYDYYGYNYYNYSGKD